MEKVGVGVIGCGIAKWHLEGFDLDERANVIGIAGPDADRCAQIAAEHRVPHVYNDYHDLLNRDDIQAVSVAVPNHLHLPVALAAFAAGKHVLMEKPLARNAIEGQQMVDAARASHRILGIIFNRRPRADMQVLSHHIAGGGLGEIYHAKAFWLRRSGIPGLGSWFTSQEGAGGGPLIDLGVHVLDMALWLMGNPTITSVSAATYAKLGPQGKGNWGGNRFRITENRPYEVEDLAVAMLRTDSGATIMLEAGWAAHISASDEFGVYLLGDQGGAELHVKDYATVDTLRLFTEVNGIPMDTMPRLKPKPPSAGHGEVISQFLDAVIDGVPMSPSGEEGLDRTRIIDAVYQSALEGREIPMTAVHRLTEV